MENTEIKNEMVVAEPVNQIATRNENVKKCTLNLEKEENQTKLYNVLSGSAEILLNDIIGTEINMTGYFLDKHQAPSINEETGEIIGTSTKYRIILFDDEGKTYATGSYGIYNALEMITSIFGVPTDDKPIKVKVDKKPTKNGHNTLTLIKI